MDVGELTEEVSVTSRVTELQSTSGERSFTLESEALKNIAQQRPRALQLRDAGARRAVAEHRQRGDRLGRAASRSTASGRTRTT